MLAAAGLAGAALATHLHVATLLGFASFAAACGTVAFVLTVNSLIADLVPRDSLTAANARNELARALVSLAAPIVVGQLVISAGPAAAYLLAAVMALASAACAMRLPAQPWVARPKRALMAELAEGARFVVADPMLRGIAVCALFWNAAFFLLLATYVPFTVAHVSADPRLIGLTQTGYGLGLVAAALAAPVIFRTVSPRAILVFGPAASVAAPLIMLIASGPFATALLFLGQVMLGFGPMLWLICQTGIRQLVTPAALLGRVGATLQLAIYGVRPLGALAAGALSIRFGTDAAMWAAAILFALSLLAILLSALIKLTDFRSVATPSRGVG